MSEASLLGCGFCGRRGCGCVARSRWEFAVGPNGTVLEILFFPNRHGTLEGVDGEAASVECGGAVRGADGDEYRGFFDFEPAKPMGNRDAVDGEFFVECRGDFSDFGDSHGFVGLVVEVEGAAAVGVVADAAVESDDSAVGGGAHMVDQRGDIDWLADEEDEIAGGGVVCGGVCRLGRRGRHGGGLGARLAATHGRKEGYFVAGEKRGGPSGELLVARSYE
jgi:hypothetical protein